MQIEAVRYVGVGEIADLLAVHPATVRGWCEAGELRACKVGRWRVHPDDLARFIKGRCNDMRPADQSHRIEVSE